MLKIYSSGTLTVWAGINEADELAIDAQDLGGHPLCDEYEYFIRIAEEDWSLLRAALDGAPEADVVELVAANAQAICGAGEVTWLTNHGVPHTFSNWMN